MRLRLFVAWCLALATPVLAACSSGDPSDPGAKTAPGPSSDDPGTNPPAAGGVTFHKDVEPILQKSCQGCHVAGGIAPFPLVTYADAKDVSVNIVTQTHARTMPPWGAQDTSECTPPAPWKNDTRLSDQEIATIASWHEGGDPEGNPADAPPPRTDGPSSGLTGATSLAPAAAFDLQASKDTFECFVLDPQITKTTYLNGTFFVPGNKTIVHHAIVYMVPPGAQTPGDSYDCFGGPGVDSATLFAGWVPGGVPNEYPAGVGLPLEAGTKFIMQIHYHPHANATQDPDRTTFQFRTSDTAPDWVATTKLIGNFGQPVNAQGTGLEPGSDDPPSGPKFVIPAGTSGHVESMRYTVPAGAGSGHILSILPHMHLAGHDEKISIVKGGQSSCLVQNPQWDFNWQRAYQYDSPLDSLPTIGPGDVVELRCTYDNTMNNVQLAQALGEAGFNQPKDIALGEATTDEMCLGAFTLIAKAK